MTERGRVGEIIHRIDEATIQLTMAVMRGIIHATDQIAHSNSVTEIETERNDGGYRLHISHTPRGVNNG